jgi:hypothetical protein
MKILQLILSAVTAVALVTIAVQLSKIQKIPEPVINIAAPQIPAPIIEEVIVQVDVPAPVIQTVEVKVPAPVIETVKVNVPTPQFSGNMSVDIDTYSVVRALKSIDSELGDIDSALSSLNTTISFK